MGIENKTQRALVIYVNSAADLAESVKKDAQKKGYITEATLVLLNKFIVAANNVDDLTTAIKDLTKDLN